MTDAHPLQVLILAPRGRDAVVVSQLLSRNGVESIACADLPTLVEAVSDGAGVAILTEEALVGQDLTALTDWLERQEAWSDFPFLVLAAQRMGQRPQAAQSVLTGLANVVLLERPINPDTLQKGVASALRARRRQYSARAQLAERQQAEERLELALHAGRLGAWSLQMPSRVLEASDQCKAIFGRSPDDPFRYDDLLASIHADDRAGQAATIQSAIQDARPFRGDYRVIWPDQSLHWVEIRGRASTDADGEVMSLAGVAQDISERYEHQRALEESRLALKQLNEGLEARIATRTQDLAQANDRLMAEIAERERVQSYLVQSQKMEAVGQLTGGVAHDFNNLLTIIRSAADFLTRPDLPEPRRARYVTAISQTVDRAAKLTGQLLAFARRQALTPTVFDVARQIEAVAELVQPLVGGRIQIALELPAQACLVKADISQFETALVNLAVNARDAMQEEGRLLFKVRDVTEVPAVRGHLSASGHFFVVSVSDSGCGIDAEQLPNIFEPFFTTKDVGKGTGLGLSQVYGFAKQSGGDVDVESEPGVGTTFSLYLPRAVETEAVEQTSDASPKDDGPTPGEVCVLVVEDNAEVGAFATEMLNDLGYRSVSAGNGVEALDMLARDSGRFDAVFSDVMMPGMGGVELAQKIRSLYPTLPVLLTSGYSAVLAQEGSHGFELLQKPYSVEALSILLRKVVATDRAASS